MPRYAALGVIDRAGHGLERFFTTGIDAETHSAIGDLPRGRGILGVLIRDAKPLRLHEIAAGPPLGRLPAQPSADEDLPRRPDRAPGRRLREPLPHREGRRRRLHHGGRGAHSAPRRAGGGRDRKRAPVRVVDALAARARDAQRDRQRARLRGGARAALVARRPAHPGARRGEGRADRAARRRRLARASPRPRVPVPTTSSGHASSSARRRSDAYWSAGRPSGSTRSSTTPRSTSASPASSASPPRSTCR